MSFLKNISNPEHADLELVNAYKRTGEMKILGSLYERYMELVYGVCLKYLQDTELAKDAVMQIFEELVTKVHKHEIANFKSWLYTLAKNFCLMQMRSPRNLKTVSIDTTNMQSGEELHLDGVIQQEETYKKLEKCLNALSADQKESVELFYLQQKCYREISEITGNDLNRVRSLIQNGRRQLKNCMDISS